ncbi:MAG: collagen-like protein [Methylococcaceae bacterium]|nr:collagen-like protein [Methylococcaceae bacterium]
MTKHQATSTNTVILRLRPVALAGAIAALVGSPATSWADSVTLHADSYVSSSDTPGTKQDNDPVLVLKNGITGFLRFRLADTLRTGVTKADIDKAILKIFIPAITTGGNLTIRPVISDWAELTIPAQGVPPSIDPGPAQSFELKTGFAGRWVLFDVTDIFKNWLPLPSANNYGLALTVEGGSLLDAIADTKENAATSHPAELEVLVNTSGTTGATGATGETGPAGATGATGAPGNDGATGPQGLQGVTGPIGLQGPTGPQGIQGITGSAGPVGPTGATGSQGLTFQGDWSAATSYAQNDSVFFNGSSYLSLQNSNLNQLPDSNSPFWSLLAQAGATGALGATGPQGTQGETGPIGLQGPAGPQGIQGITGPTGETGATGPVGPTGATGADGVSGAPGEPGLGMVFTPSFYNPSVKTTSFVSLNGLIISANAGLVSTIMPSACTFKALYAKATIDGDPAANTLIYTLYKNGTSQPMTTSLTVNATITSATNADTSHTVSVVTGDVVTVGITQTNETPLVVSNLTLWCQ